MKLKFLKRSSKITKYFFDFLMLFLAVFLGFVAENYREKRQNKKIADEYLELLIVDLKKDMRNANITLKDYKEERLPNFDYVINNFSEIMNNEYTRFETIQNAYNSYGDFYPTTTAYNQIKNIGFRFIENQELIDSIQSYYYQMDDLLFEAKGTDKKYQNMWDAGGKLISEFKVDSLKATQNSLNSPFTVTATFIETNDRYLHNYYNKIKSARYGLKVNEYFVKKQLSKAEELIEMIDEYLHKN